MNHMISAASAFTAFELAYVKTVEVIITITPYGFKRKARFHHVDVYDGRKMVYYHVDYIEPLSRQRYWKTMRYELRNGRIVLDRAFDWRMG